MTIDQQTLSRLPLFSRLSDEEILVCLPSLHEVCVDLPGTMVFFEGDPGDALFLILAGDIEIRKLINRETGSTKSLATLPAGEFFGEMALLTAEPRSATARTCSPNTRLLRLDRAEFLRLMTSAPHIAAQLMGGLVSILSERLRSTSIELVTLYETGRIISATRDPHTLSQQVLECLVRATGAEAGVVLLWNEVIECFEPFAAVGFSPPLGVFHLESRLATFLTELRAPARSGHGSVDERIEDLNTSGESLAFAPFINEQTGSLAYLGDGKMVSGAVILRHSVTGHFSLPQMTLLQGVADQVSPALLSGKLMKENESRETYHQVYVTPDL